MRGVVETPNALCLSILKSKRIVMNTFHGKDNNVLPLLFEQVFSSPFLGNLLRYLSFHSAGTCFFITDFLKEWVLTFLPWHQVFKVSV